MTAKKNTSGDASKCRVMGFGLADVMILLTVALPTLFVCGSDAKPKNEVTTLAIPQDFSTEQVLPPTSPAVMFAQPEVRKREAVQKAPKNKTSKESAGINQTD